MPNKERVHFHSSDGRFCGATEQGRRFSLDIDDVTCCACKYGRAGYRTFLTEQGAEYVRSLACEASV